VLRGPPCRLLASERSTIKASVAIPAIVKATCHGAATIIPTTTRTILTRFQAICSPFQTSACSRTDAKHTDHASRFAPRDGHMTGFAAKRSAVRIRPPLVHADIAPAVFLVPGWNRSPFHVP
jgi:hypothetical protein